MQIEKTSEPLPHPCIAAPQLCEMSWPQTCAFDVGQMREFFPLLVAVAEATRVSPPRTQTLTILGGGTEPAFPFYHRKRQHIDASLIRQHENSDGHLNFLDHHIDLDFSTI
jgi:hypothetical protein